MSAQVQLYIIYVAMLVASGVGEFFKILPLGTTVTLMAGLGLGHAVGTQQAVKSADSASTTAQATAAAVAQALQEQQTQANRPGTPTM